jgi:hypothetical protein
MHKGYYYIVSMLLSNELLEGRETIPGRSYIKLINQLSKQCPFFFCRLFARLPA